jgi:hypothetical protein
MRSATLVSEALPNYELIPSVHSAADSLHNTIGTPRYEDLEPITVIAIDGNIEVGVFAIRELIRISPSPMATQFPTGQVLPYIIEIRFEDNVDLKMISSGFKPRTLLLIRRAIRESDAVT